MSNDDDIQPPQATHWDKTHKAVKIGLSAIPVIGGSASELFDHVFQSPLANRREEWMQAVYERLAVLELPDAESLAQDADFVSTLVEATLAAVKTESVEKREYLRRAVEKSAMKIRPSNDWSIQFVRYIDDLTPQHIVLLYALCAAPTPLVSTKGYQGLYDSYASTLGQSVDRDYFKFLCIDLSIKGLVRLSADIDDYDDLYEASSLLIEQTDDSLPRIKVTEMGQEFIAWICEEGVQNSVSA